MGISFLIPILVTLAGTYLLFKLKFFIILHPFRTLFEFAEELKNRESRRSFFLALAGTLGVGNIFGVSAGIMIGGAGCLFWMLVSAVFSMIIKYAETLTVCSYPENDGGMAGVIEKSFKKHGKTTAIAYAFFTVLLALFMGAAMQSKAITDLSFSTLGLNPYVCAFILVILFMPCLLGGVRKIQNVTEILIPLTTIIYIFMCFAVIMLKIENVPSVIKEIFSSAFSFKAVTGGVIAVTVKEGFARGILSNEAGAGTSALGHSTAKGRTAHTAGLFGIFEVFFDTVVLCMLSGVTILLSVADIEGFNSPMSLIGSAFTQTLGAYSGYLLAFLTLSFACSTVMCWYFYGQRLTSLYFSKLVLIYPCLFIAFLFISPVLPSHFLLYAVDVLLLFMSVLSISAVIKNVRK